MTTADAFLKVIIAEPQEDVHRLVFADWLEEHGEEGRASFIRAQCELAKPLVCEYSHLDTCFDRRMSLDDVATTGCKACAAVVPLRRREEELWLTLYNQLASELHQVLPFPRSTAEGCAISWHPGPGPQQIITTTFRRGFVEHVACETATWMGEECDCAPRIRGGPCLACSGSGVVNRHGTRLVRAAPLGSVRLSDRGPQRGRFHASASTVSGHLRGKEYWMWWPERSGNFGAAIIPISLHRQLTGAMASANKQYPTRQAALDALSRALLAWAHLAAEREDVRLSPCRCIFSHHNRSSMCPRCARLCELDALVEGR